MLEPPAFSSSWEREPSWFLSSDLNWLSWLLMLELVLELVPDFVSPAASAKTGASASATPTISVFFMWNLLFKWLTGIKRPNGSSAFDVPGLTAISVPNVP